MSLILEALRKSEAERRRGVAPNVYAELPPSPRTRPTGIPTWAWLLLAGAVLLIALWLVHGTTPRTPAPEPAAASTAIAPTSKPAMLPPVARLSPTPVAATAPVVVSKPVAPPQAVPATAKPQAAMVEPAPRTTPPISAAVAAPAATDTLRLSDLSVDERKALPTLKLSMHMWNDDPAQRFVILDGNRLHEGDRIGDAVVTAITTDGVVLDWNGRRLKLPIR
jgi:general secretion pathway protein B